MITKEYRRTKAIGPDLDLGRKGELLVYNLLISKLDPARFEVIDLNEIKESFKCGDILVYDKVDDFIFLYEVEAKRKKHFNGVVRGYEIFCSDDEFIPITKYDDLSITNKDFKSLKDLKFSIDGLFEKRKLTNEEINECTFIMVNEEDVNNLVPKIYIKVNVKNSVLNLYNKDAKYGHPRIKQRWTSRGYDKLIHIPFNECEFVNDYTN